MLTVNHILEIRVLHVFELYFYLFLHVLATFTSMCQITGTTAQHWHASHLVAFPPCRRTLSPFQMFLNFSFSAHLVWMARTVAAQRLQKNAFAKAPGWMTEGRAAGTHLSPPQSRGARARAFPTAQRGQDDRWRRARPAAGRSFPATLARRPICHRERTDGAAAHPRR